MSIDLTNPKTLLNNATKLTPESVQIDRTSIRIWYTWRDATDNVLKSDTITLSGTDYTDVMGQLVPSNAVGVALGTVMIVAIKRKIKDMMALIGTVENNGL